MTLGSRVLPVLVLTAAAVSMPAVAHPPGQVDSESDKAWTFSITPYLWASGMQGEIDFRGQESDVDVGFDDILEDLDLGAQVHLEARHDRWGFFLQPNYISMETDTRSGALQLDIDSTLWFVEFGGLYEVGRWGTERPVSLDFFLGGRYWHVENDFSLKTPVPGVRQDSSESTQVIDPIVGLETGIDLLERLRLVVRGDIGGFDISTKSSDLTWQALGLIGLKLSSVIEIWTGYRALNIDYDQGSGADSEAFDITLEGFLVGLTFRF